MSIKSLQSFLERKPAAQSRADPMCERVIHDELAQNNKGKRNAA